MGRGGGRGSGRAATRSFEEQLDSGDRLKAAIDEWTIERDCSARTLLLKIADDIDSISKRVGDDTVMAELDLTIVSNKIRDILYSSQCNKWN